MHTWHWHTWQGMSYLRCSLLQPWAHGFFTQQFSPRLPIELVEVLQPETPTYRVKQVHGKIVLTPSEITQWMAKVTSPDEIDGDAPLPSADGLVTEESGQAVWVATADCVPVLIADAKTGQVAAVHAGWRGTAAAIAPEAVARLLAQGSKLKDLRVALGPAIAGEVYQVSTTVAAEVGATVIATTPEINLQTEPNVILDKLRQLPDSPLLSDPQPGRIRLDVQRVNALQLEHLGLKVEQVAIAPYCTYRHSDYFFSYRRERLKQVQWSGIVSH
jgi:polyphenol oxidase